MTMHPALQRVSSNMKRFLPSHTPINLLLVLVRTEYGSFYVAIKRE